MRDSDSCTLIQIEIGGQKYERDTSYYDDNDNCHDCGIKNGQGHYHHLGCDMERCPKCKGQLIGCDCFED